MTPPVSLRKFAAGPYRLSAVPYAALLEIVPLL
jgi:hypothetical protein